MSGNRKDWRWCRWGRHWVFDFPLPVGAFCGTCYLDLCNRDKDRHEAKEAAIYLEKDYAAVMF
jgi:hypothetical protein